MHLHTALPLAFLTLLLAVACSTPDRPVESPPAGSAPLAPSEPAATHAPPAADTSRTREAVCPDVNADKVDPNKMCTERGCQEGASIATPDRWLHEPGDYTITLTADGKPITCTGTLPLKPCDQPGITCSEPDVYIGASGCALPPEQHAFADITFPKTYPAVVQIKVEHNGKVTLDQTVNLGYRTVLPNGAGCGYACCQASATLP